MNFAEILCHYIKNEVYSAVSKNIRAWKRTRSMFYSSMERFSKKNPTMFEKKKKFPIGWLGVDTENEVHIHSKISTGLKRGFLK